MRLRAAHRRLPITPCAAYALAMRCSACHRPIAPGAPLRLVWLSALALRVLHPGCLA